MKGFEYKSVVPFGKERGDKTEKDAELQLVERAIEKTERVVELWKDSYDAVMADLADVEAKEGPLDPDDRRLTAPKICAMRLDEEHAMLKDLKEELREVSSRALN